MYDLSFILKDLRLKIRFKCQYNEPIMEASYYLSQAF